jgi:hypothetical protein
VTKKLRRRTEPARPSEYILLGATLVLLVTLSGVWQLARPALVDWLARSSLGNWCRVELISQALAWRYPGLRPEWNMQGDVFSRNDNYVAGVVWVARREYDMHKACWVRDHYAFASADFDLRGRLCCPHYSGEVAMDRDNDGSLEAVIDVASPGRVATRSYLAEAVIRLRADVNELVGMVAIDTTGLNAQLASVWQARGGCGQDLVFFPYTLLRLPSGALQRTDRPLLADLMWMAPGGVLTPRTVIESPRVRIWTPADGKPIEFPADQDASEVCKKLWPQAFSDISPITTQPTSDVTTQEIERE